MSSAASCKEARQETVPESADIGEHLAGKSKAQKPDSKEWF